MSFKDKFHSWINASDETFAEGTDAEFEDDFDFAPGAAPEKEEEPVHQAAPRTQSFHTKSEKANSNNVVSIAQKPAAQSRPRVVFQKIDRFEEVNKVADILKEKRIVVLNLESCPMTLHRELLTCFTAFPMQMTVISKRLPAELILSLPITFP